MVCVRGGNLAGQRKSVPIGSKIWSLLFGCRHRELSRAFTNGGETYKVCLKCGAHLPYSWETMTVLPQAKQARKQPSKAAGPRSH
jgi:hypothetical protein